MSEKVLIDQNLNIIKNKYDIFEEGKRRAKKSLIADSPTQITFEITNRCNLQCNYCYPLRKELTEIKACDMNPDYIYSMEYEISQAKSLVFSGLGEPLLNKNIFEYAKFMRKHNSGALITIPTNGTQKITDEQIEIISRYSINLLVSLDSVNDDIQKITRPQVIAHDIMENIRSISKRIIDTGYKHAIAPVINSVVTKYSLDHLIDVTKFAIDTGCRAHCLLSLNEAGPTPTFYKTNSISTNEDFLKAKLEVVKCHELAISHKCVIVGTLLNYFEEINDLYNKLNNENNICYDLWLFTNIVVAGNMCVCANPKNITLGHIREKNMTIDDMANNLMDKIKETSQDRFDAVKIWLENTSGTFAEVWNGEVAIYLRKMMLEECGFGECKSCIKKKLHNSWLRCT